MADSKKVKEDELNEEKQKQKTCFAIMPIADHHDYTPGHFTRVYNHLIKPACEQAGYKVIRADEAKASHMIMFDILKNIIDCDMAICDLSSKNANVFYELGLRQAFNKKTILITDGITNTPFDINGFRYVKYSESLRVDTVINDVAEISAMLQETEKASEDDINSIVNLLKIQPAKIDKLQLNQHESVLYELIKNLDSKISYIANTNRKSNILLDVNTQSKDAYPTSRSPTTGLSFESVSNNLPNFIHSAVFQEGHETIGKYLGKNDAGNLIFKSGDSYYEILDTPANRLTLKSI